MQKVIRINESQLNEMIKKVMTENEGNISPMYVKHWESKFIKAVTNLLSSGFKPEDLIEKIKIIVTPNNEQK
jgi:hypothetical protein